VISVTVKQENIAVSDTGQGLSDENLNGAFDPGFTTKNGAQGGLGLAISYLNIEAHGGEMTLEHNKPHGLTVKIWLPLSLQQQESKKYKDQKIILFISNKPLAESVYKTYCGDNQVAEAVHHQEVEALLEEETWDVIITDQSTNFGTDAEVIKLNL